MPARWLLLSCLLAACADPPAPAPVPSTSLAPAPSTSLAPAPAPAPSPSPAPTPTPTRPSWLYEIPTEHGTSYLFAMLEPGCPLHESFPSDYEILFQVARTVMVPVAWTEEEEQDLVLHHGMRADAHLDQVLGPERFVTFVDLTDLPPEIAPQILPTMAFALVAQGLAADAYGTTHTDGRISPAHDAVLRRRTSGLPVVGALSAQEAAESFDALPARPSAELARAAMDHVTELRAHMAARLAAYRAGDDAQVARDADSSFLGVTAYETAVRAERARTRATMAPRIVAELRAGNALVLVPVDDAVGESGLLARLAADHLEATRISVPDTAD